MTLDSNLKTLRAFKGWTRTTLTESKNGWKCHVSAGGIGVSSDRFSSPDEATRDCMLAYVISKENYDKFLEAGN